MKGIHFVVDEAGRRTAVVIDLAEHGELWENFYDILVFEERAEEPRATLAAVQRELAPG